MNDEQNKPTPHEFVYNGDPPQWFTGPIKHLLRAGWLPPDPLHPSGRCNCAGAGTCLWCLWTEKREEVESLRENLEQLLPLIDPDGKYALTADSESSTIIHALNNLTQRWHTKGNLEGMEEAERWKAKYDELAASKDDS